MKQIYNSLTKKYGYDVKSLHWPTKDRQEMAFKAIAETVNLCNTSILDVGCGFGDFYFFLKKNGVKVNYTGIDVSDKIIEIGKRKHPSISNCLKIMDVKDIVDRYDYVVISGTFNLKIDDNWEFIKSTLKKVFDLCNKGVVFNLISTYVDYQENHLFYVNPCDIFEYCKTLTKWINIKYDYNDYEYTISIFKVKR